jgi:hypothetical protein
MNIRGYDAWKTASPYDDMTPEQEKMEDLESRLAAMQTVLGECAAYFDERSDISSDHNEDGSPRPNLEMRLLQAIEEVM